MNIRVWRVQVRLNRTADFASWLKNYFLILEYTRVKAFFATVIRQTGATAALLRTLPTKVIKKWVEVLCNSWLMEPKTCT